jgi:hypothetical protein
MPQWKRDSSKGAGHRVFSQPGNGPFFCNCAKTRNVALGDNGPISRSASRQFPLPALISSLKVRASRTSHGRRKDRFGETMRLMERAQEDIYFAERDQELIKSSGKPQPVGKQESKPLSWALANWRPTPSKDSSPTVTGWRIWMTRRIGRL